MLTQHNPRQALLRRAGAHAQAQLEAEADELAARFARTQPRDWAMVPFAVDHEQLPTRNEAIQWAAIGGSVLLMLSSCSRWAS